jgi:hypothetical protein
VTVGSHRSSGILAWAGVVAIALGVILAVVPVSNPGVQRCGAPIDFLVAGEFDRIPDASGRIERDGRVITLDSEAATRAIERPCSERVERRAIPAGLLVVGGSVMGLVAMGIAMVHAWRRAAARADTETETDKAEVP